MTFDELIQDVIDDVDSRLWTKTKDLGLLVLSPALLRQSIVKCFPHKNKFPVDIGFRVKNPDFDVRSGFSFTSSVF